MHWRVRGDTGWLENKAGRERLFREELDTLRADVRRLQPQTDELLGNDVASCYLRKWVPDVVRELKKSGGG